MDGHSQLGIGFGIPALIVLSAFAASKVMAWDDQRDAEIATQEASIVASLEDLGVEDPHKVDGKDRYSGVVGNCHTTIWTREAEAQFRVATRPGLLGPHMRLIAVVDLGGNSTINEIEEFSEAGCFDNQ